MTNRINLVDENYWFKRTSFEPTNNIQLRPKYFSLQNRYFGTKTLDSSVIYSPSNVPIIERIQQNTAI